MTDTQDEYSSIFSERYCRGSTLLKLFSERNKVKNIFIYFCLFQIETWRQLWINLAEAELQLELPQISQEMINELIKQKKNIDWEKVREEEKRLRHDVMAHNHAYGAVLIFLYFKIFPSNQNSFLL